MSRQNIKLKAEELPSSYANESVIEFSKIKQHFTSSANTYKSNAQLQYDVGQCLIEGLLNASASQGKPFLNVLDLGCGPGLFSEPLQSVAGSLISLDLSAAMLSENQSTANSATSAKVQANSHALPFKDNSFDAIFSSLMIQWCDLEKVLQQVHNVLKEGATAYISTLVKGSLYELEYAWSQVDSDTHLHHYLSESDIVGAVNRNRWAHVVMEQSQNTYWFNTPRDLARELKNLGANYVERRNHKGLTPKSKWQAMESSYNEAFYDDKNNAVPATYQVVYLQLTK
ncbi:MAG: methyltransferase domain-containing protein [Gammaproteobacteria bacterium]|nr:methyltransferase domain-containing protein [Gammaproteobacteria bacterium]